MGRVMESPRLSTMSKPETQLFIDAFDIGSNRSRSSVAGATCDWSSHLPRRKMGGKRMLLPPASKLRQSPTRSRKGQPRRRWRSRRTRFADVPRAFPTREASRRGFRSDGRGDEPCDQPDPGARSSALRLRTVQLLDLRASSDECDIDLGQEQSVLHDPRDAG